MPATQELAPAVINRLRVNGLDIWNSEYIERSQKATERVIAVASANVVGMKMLLWSSK